MTIQQFHAQVHTSTTSTPLFRALQRLSMAMDRRSLLEASATLGWPRWF